MHLHQSTDDKHLHIIANRIDFYGNNQVKSHHIGERASKHGEALSKERSWKTIKEISGEKKLAIKTVLLEEKGRSRSLSDLIGRMDGRGYVMQISENSKGLNGARIIPKADMNMNPSVLEKVMKQGFKLSEIDPKLKIKDIVLEINKSLSKDRGRSF